MDHYQEGDYCYEEVGSVANPPGTGGHGGVQQHTVIKVSRTGGHGFFTTSRTIGPIRLAPSRPGGHAGSSGRPEIKIVRGRSRAQMFAHSGLPRQEDPSDRQASEIVNA
ncbi:hypothetical protein BS78_05G200000 [Paspalum vaginatum]|nr:hypothetical protein BS78_05G200000 [Paspalum vaginatum]